MGEPAPVTVEGDWGPDQSKSMKNKLLLYFQSKRKSGGGDCRVEAEEGAPRAAVFFVSAEVRERVLAKEDHEVVIANKTIKLRLTSSPSNGDGVSGSSKDSKTDPGNEPAEGSRKELVQSGSVVLDNVGEDLPRDLLSMLVESISGLDESCYILEIIWEVNKAVVTFNTPADVEKFLAVSQTNKKLKKYNVTVRPLEAAVSVRVESLPTAVKNDMLEMYFEKNWALPDDIAMIPTEQAAIVTFSDPKVVENICLKQDYVIGSNPPIKVYPYYESLCAALYGKERPTWKMPNPFTEKVHPVLYKFLQFEKEFKSLSDKMRPVFCSVDLINADEIKLSPLPSFLRQTNLTSKQVDGWMSTTQDALQVQMSEYTVFECAANAPAWKSAEKEIRSIVGVEDAALDLSAIKGVLTVAGRVETLQQIKAPLESIVLTAMRQIERQTNGVSEAMNVPPAIYHMLTQEGLQKAALDISPDMDLSYKGSSNTLTISGLPEELNKAKSWILDRNMNRRKKHLNIPPDLLDFLRTVDAMEMSQELFTSQSISAIYSIDSRGFVLTGSSDNVLDDAEKKMKAVLAHNILDVEDVGVIELPNWTDLIQQMLAKYNSSKRTVAIQMQPGRGDKVTVAGFGDSVQEVSRNLKEFIVNFSRVQETVRLESCAVVQFIDKKQDWKSIANDNDVRVNFKSESSKITLSGAHINVQKAKSCIQALTGVLFTDNYIVDKPGAKKYFQSQGKMFLPSIMSDLSCVVVLRPENQEEEEEKQEMNAQGNGFSHCKVQTTSGILVSVIQEDICRLRVDVVVNAANEDLQHVGGLAFALAKTAGPQLQKSSDDYVRRHGKLGTGDAIVTDAFNLPCKYVIHAVGPRFSNYNQNTAVKHLKLAVKQSLNQAEKFKCTSVALPAISSGIFGFPGDLCASTIAQAVREYCDSPKRESLGSLREIHLVDNNVTTVKLLATAVSSEFADLGPTMMTSQPQQPAGATGYQQQGRDERQNFSGRGRQGGHRGGNRGGQQRGGQGGQRGHNGGRGEQREQEWEFLRGPQDQVPNPRSHTRSQGMEQYTSEGLRIILCKGNIQEQRTDVIVNTIADNMNLSQGAVSKALLNAAGPNLQTAIRSEANVPALKHADVVITDGFRLKCQKVFHAVCPYWDNGQGQAQEELLRIIRVCLEEAEQLHMTSLSFPAIGTGNLNFPRDLVANFVIHEVHVYSRKKNPRYLREVAMVVHPSDTQTVDCFTKVFQKLISQRKVQHEAGEPEESQFNQSQTPTASYSRVSSPSSGVYRMQMGRLALEVSSGDITKETSDAIVNSSNADFNLSAGVSKAILTSAGPTVLDECTEIVHAPAYQPSPLIVTAAGMLPCKNIVHIYLSDPKKIKEMVYLVLKACEENKFNSVTFPALGTGQAGAKPADVADAMVEAVLDFVRKKHPTFVHSVKILIFQTNMMTDFHNSMKKREGEKVEEKSLLTKFKDFFGFGGNDSFTSGDKETSNNVLVLEKQEFESAVFQLCADNKKAVNDAKARIDDLIQSGQMKRTIRDNFINQLSRSDMEQLKKLQRDLSVSIFLERGGLDQDNEPTIHLEGLTADVLIAEATVKELIQKVERTENLKSKALMMKGVVEWQYTDGNGQMIPFDMCTNAELEEALKKKQKSVMIKINNQPYRANLEDRKAVSENRGADVKLFRKDLKEESLPADWDDMKGDFNKTFTVAAGSPEYNKVEAELKNNGLAANIISIERVQNKTMWKGYQLLKKQMEGKNKHTNNERQLFHGTGAQAIDLINKHGFNRSYAGVHGRLHGDGCYFSVNPTYSKGYAAPDSNQHRRMYLARVLIGDFSKGKKDMKAPPQKGNAPDDLFDSVVDQTPNPTMFIIFNDYQAYPEYLITFT